MKEIKVESISNSITVEDIDISSYSGGESITNYSFYIRDYQNRLEDKLNIELDVYGRRSAKFLNNVLFISDDRCIYVDKGDYIYEPNDDFYLVENIIVTFSLSDEPIMALNKDKLLKELI